MCLCMYVCASANVRTWEHETCLRERSYVCASANVRTWEHVPIIELSPLAVRIVYLCALTD